MEEPLKTLKGTNGTISVFDDRVTISRKGFLAWASQGAKGDRTYFFEQLSSVDFKKPNALVNGYIKFITGGTNDASSSPLQIASDSNAVVLRAFDRKIPALSLELYEFILEKIKESKSVKSSGVLVSSSADEIKKFKALFDDGIITEEEFEAKKKQLLGL